MYGEIVMLIRSVPFFVSFIICQSLFAAGPACFNYETYEHQGPAAGTNRALLNYDHALIALRNAAIAPLAPGAYQIQVSKRRVLAGGLWVHALHALGGGPLNYQEAAFMTLERQLGTGIPVVFAFPAEIAAIAAGFPIPAVAAFFGWGVPVLTQYLNRSLGGGGYRNVVLAAALFRLRHNIPAPNYINIGGFSADTVLIHIHDPNRVSKNVKDLSYNSLNIPAYFTIKDTIDDVYNFLGIAPPHSATVLSSNFLQLN
jgi:hypothetical protein